MSVKFFLEKMRRVADGVAAFPRTKGAAKTGTKGRIQPPAAKSQAKSTTSTAEKGGACAKFQDCRMRGRALCEVCSAKKQEMVRKAAKMRQELDFYMQGTLLYSPAMDEPTIGRTPHFSKFAKARPISPPEPPHTASSTSTNCPTVLQMACDAVAKVWASCSCTTPTHIC
ncbi:unnamed protein product [Vitrella brassicaformis CCMP3155]|uniref:Uncharacterized protein n=1 Tax=Vitrella brassicaformis (strain CCMP3155) TaxID=1169540 RepID=A0A0G4ETL5_VITBC|nr:unnamed protein product [Vitrella brassicaformis CCMP3155]|eukprot:CEM01951.1 unnamed protein product [Vitrella brassicaformis CCMP3155]